MTDALDATVAGLRRLGLILAGNEPELTPLTGGVASDIWLVRAGSREFVVKRALEKLRVAADWRAPVSRNASEVAWFRHAGMAAPDAVPVILAHDPAQGYFVMNYLPPASHPVWKRELQAGRADPTFAAKVGASLAMIHASTAGHLEIAQDFNDNTLFRAIRLEPYLEFTAAKHPAISGALLSLVDRTLQNRKALVHGDISPKNILVGPKGPVFLDAECAWFGDPAFDLAFCLNHLLLKCLWTPSARAGFLASFEALRDAYFREITWEPLTELEARAAALLPALLLARIDGKSPVEYIQDEMIKRGIRAFAIPLIETPAGELSLVRARWAEALPGIVDKT
ncbi:MULTISPECIES: phosphotransferase [unclassified Mesorhizobium]|uniref:phosphotransferase family protein n=1 Tax=unclassified Mesorhizobium TaxID=325217 RepID=UPI000FDADFDF|nr:MULTISPECIES: phosphotransferase [unclassified Mesorhizobium]TGQ39461.1 aminoglycoside phosphotransferase family protein [Mesorhizobium sp. M00.F.Ca.ET.216.01.1.1]TIS91841.1 MAG: aminoglycoside phosphotransferase family protein [Mesorhizobium sp.]TJW43777.1 MAG: aminoglycoside phosphotransferase family protein [Mesorhizobium sp.]